MGNFIDKTFTVIADILFKILPASKKEKDAYMYYKAGLSAQSKGKFSEALVNYYESLKLEEDDYDRSFTLQNIGLIYYDLGKKQKALGYCHLAVEMNSNLPQALNTIGIIYHSQSMRAQLLASSSRIEDDAEYERYIQLSEDLYDKAAEYWNRALELAPDSYDGARNWLKATGRLRDYNKIEFNGL